MHFSPTICLTHTLPTHTPGTMALPWKEMFLNRQCICSGCLPATCTSEEKQAALLLTRRRRRRREPKLTSKSISISTFTTTCLPVHAMHALHHFAPRTQTLEAGWHLKLVVEVEAWEKEEETPVSSPAASQTAPLLGRLQACLWPGGHSK